MSYFFILLWRSFATILNNSMCMIFKIKIIVIVTHRSEPSAAMMRQYIAYTVAIRRPHSGLNAVHQPCKGILVVI